MKYPWPPPQAITSDALWLLKSSNGTRSASAVAWTNAHEGSSSDAPDTAAAQSAHSGVSVCVPARVGGKPLLLARSKRSRVLEFPALLLPPPPPIKPPPPPPPLTWLEDLSMKPRIAAKDAMSRSDKNDTSVCGPSEVHPP